MLVKYIGVKHLCAAKKMGDGSAKFYYQTANETANVFVRYGEI